MKPAIGLLLAFAIGFACRVFGIPSPAPTLIIGAFLAVAITSGYVGMGLWLARSPRTAARVQRNRPKADG